MGAVHVNTDHERIVRDVLGSGRTRRVLVHRKTNFDDLEILRVHVVYDPERPPNVREMSEVVNALIANLSEPDSPFPVVDFQTDEDHESFAAE